MSRLKAAKLIYIITSVLIVIFGLAIIINPTIANEILCRVSGIVMIIAGVAKLFGYFSNDRYNIAFQFHLTLGIIMVALGVALAIIPDFFATYIAVVISVLVIINALFTIQNSIEAKKFGIQKWWVVLVAGICATVAGVLSLVNPGAVSDLIMIFLGFAMVFEGIENIVVAAITIKNIKK